MSAGAALHARWSLDAGEHEHVVFAVEGMHCAGCARTIEKAVGALSDVEAVRVNVATARVSVDWHGRGDTGLEEILAAVARAGFKALPLAGDAAAAEYQRERRVALKRVGLASLGMMQAMMYLGALYGASDIDASMAQLMRIAGMVIVTPVLFYSGAPFFAGAIRDLRNGRLGMDVPVALALALAFVPSVLNTFRGSGEVYFDSVGMFVFFLSVGRYVEMAVRHRGLSVTEALARSLPAQVVRLDADGKRRKVAAAEIAPGDRFVVAKGGVIAVDAVIPADAPADFVAQLDESLVSGESAAVARRRGEAVRGGSLNLGDALTLVATAPASRSTLASMVTLLERAQSERPRLSRAADVAASWFVAVILLLAALTGLAWWSHDPTRAFAAVLAVLVVSCPCALSLATPTALAAATSDLARRGVLVTRVDAIERLATVDRVIFDKTGTLTSGAVAVLGVTPLDTRDVDALAIGAALERGSLHPLAAAFAAHDRGLVVEKSREFASEGVEGVIDGRLWRMGRRPFVIALAATRKVLPLDRTDAATVYLGNADGLVAAIELGAPLRDEARKAVEDLRELGVLPAIASGDNERATGAAARPLGIRQAHSRLSPDDKLWLLKHMRDSGHRVLMVGDGINDGPVLAAADVSCAMGQGSAIAQSAADLLLVNEDLRVLPRAVDSARRAMRVVRQNLGWSLVYNFTAVPLAALGLVSPWLAALGMSLSSLGVVLNARRLSAGGAP